MLPAGGCVDADALPAPARLGSAAARISTRGGRRAGCAAPRLRAAYLWSRFRRGCPRAGLGAGRGAPSSPRAPGGRSSEARAPRRCQKFAGEARGGGGAGDGEEGGGRRPAGRQAGTGCDIKKAGEIQLGPRTPSRPARTEGTRGPRTQRVGAGVGGETAPEELLQWAGLRSPGPLEGPFPVLVGCPPGAEGERPQVAAASTPDAGLRLCGWCVQCRGWAPHPCEGLAACLGWRLLCPLHRPYLKREPRRAAL